MQSEPTQTFKVSSRLPILLGDELIPNPGYAVFELVKNSHDADATKVYVHLNEVDDITQGSVVVRDNGGGMSMDVVTNEWLVLGTAEKRRKTLKNKVTEKFGRTFLGEKGIGRFAAHKLGDRIVVVTRADGEPEIVIDIDWTEFDDNNKLKLLDAIPININQRTPETFNGVNGRPSTGTKITITKLRNPLSRGNVRDLYRDIVSISSPFAGPSNFDVNLRLSDELTNWVSGLMSIKDAKNNAPFVAKCQINSEQIYIDYSFRVPDSFSGKLSSRSHPLSIPLPKPPEKPKTSRQEKDYDIEDPNENEGFFSEKDRKTLESIGQIDLHIYMFDLTPAFVRKAIGDARGLKRFLKQNGGIRVYRGEMRVFGLGGEGEDWLDLGGRRVQMPGSRISNNQIVGAVLLGSASSKLLREQTNRRGFVQDDAYRVLTKSLRFAILQIEAERFVDKARLKAVLDGDGPTHIPVLSELANLRDAIHQLGPDIEEHLQAPIKRVQKAYEETRDMLVTAASTGMSLAGVVHDVEKQIRILLFESKKADPSLSRVRQMIQDLSDMMDGLTFLLRKSTRKSESMAEIVNTAIRNYAHRFRHHNIEVINGFGTHSDDFRVMGVRNLIQANLMNLLDNAIWWLNISDRSDKKIFVGPDRQLDRWPAVIIADNGPGFSDDPETVVKPFFTRRPQGIGLGLFLADQATIKQGGRLLFPRQGDSSLPEEFIGASIAIVLPPEDTAP